MRTQNLSLGLLLAGAACSSMQVVEPAQVIPAQHPASVWVKESSGEVVDVLKPSVEGDTLRGIVAQIGEPYAVALKDITTVRALEPDKTRTWIVVVGSVAMGSFGIYELSQSTAKSTPQACPMAQQIEDECNPTLPAQ
jgi:hypothetical protein